MFWKVFWSRDIPDFFCIRSVLGDTFRVEERSKGRRAISRIRSREKIMQLQHQRWAALRSPRRKSSGSLTQISTVTVYATQPNTARGRLRPLPGTPSLRCIRLPSHSKTKSMRTIPDGASFCLARLADCWNGLPCVSHGPTTSKVKNQRYKAAAATCGEDARFWPLVGSVMSPYGGQACAIRDFGNPACSNRRGTEFRFAGPGGKKPHQLRFHRH